MVESTCCLSGQLTLCLIRLSDKCWDRTQRCSSSGQEVPLPKPQNTQLLTFPKLPGAPGDIVAVDVSDYREHTQHPWRLEGQKHFSLNGRCTLAKPSDMGRYTEVWQLRSTSIINRKRAKPQTCKLAFPTSPTSTFRSRISWKHLGTSESMALLKASSYRSQHQDLIRLEPHCLPHFPMGILSRWEYTTL